jgi:hypothetical protein
MLRQDKVLAAEEIMGAMGACGMGAFRRRWAAARCVMFLCVLGLVLAAIQVASWAHSARTAERLATPPPVQNSPELRVGLILPIRLQSALVVRDAQKGQLVEAQLMQDVPLAEGSKLAMKSVVKGTVLGLTNDSDGAGLNLTLSFTRVENRNQNLTMNTSLRAIASYQAVRTSQTPFTGPDGGTPAGWANTVQIGGDIRYGDGGLVRNRHKQKVGKGVFGGVLVHVQANPNGGCEGPINGDDHLQALWVFSADACGVYGMKGANIAHAGKSDPIGEITLHFEKNDMKLDSGTAMLLRVVAHP